MRSYDVGFSPATNIPGVFNMTLSSMGPKVVPQYIDMTTESIVELDLSPLVQNGNIDFISGAWFDNTNNDQILSVKVAGTNQIVKIPANSQGYLPTLSPNEPKFTFSCDTAPGVTINVIFYNIPLLPYLWNEEGSGGGGGGTGLEVTDLSIALSGASETLAAANPDRKIITIQNTGANSMGVNFTGGVAAIGSAGTYTLLAGGSLTFDEFVPTNEITIIGTAADVVSAFEG